MNYESRIKNYGKFVLPLFIILTSLFWPDRAYAHAFGKLYNLPVPFWLYLYGGAAAIIISFLAIGYFFSKKKIKNSYPIVNLSKYQFFKVLPAPELLFSFQLLSVFLFLLTIISGLWGIDSSYANFNMTFFWIIFVLGGTYLTALIGNFYSVINPGKILISWFERLTQTKGDGLVAYPKKLAYFPALVIYFLFIWIELFGQATPYKLSFILIQYSTINLVGILLFGQTAWFKYGEFFSVFFRIIGKVSLFKLEEGKLYLRPPFVGLLDSAATSFSELLFILFILSSTAFDGFRETLPWVRFYWQNFDDFLRPLLGTSSYFVFQTIGLVLSPLVFLLIYLILIYLSKIISRSKIDILNLMLQFAYSLVPVALVYNVAHYYTLLLTQGQEIIRLASDPLGFGWNLFGTVDVSSNLSIIDAGTTWHLQVAFILLGHIAGVYLAHIIALRVFPSHKSALISQIPMLLLMVSYTMIGLWILSQPITGGI